jgi:hypothetical protein
MNEPTKPPPPADPQTVMILPSAPQTVPLLAPATHFLVPVDTPERSLRIGREPLVIGRSEGCHLRLDDPAISGRHCVVQVDGDELWVVDLVSTNGTSVDGRRIVRRTAVPVGAVLQLGPVPIRHEVRDERSIAEESEWSGELQAASRYLTDLLPEPWVDRPIDVRWRLVPCRRLGGDAFGDVEIDRDRAALWLIDVCGHGLRAALHSVAILNTLRQRSPAEAAADPGEVVNRLNRAFPMDAHGGMFFTIWYGVIDRARRRLSFCAAGHPPALLQAGDGAPPLRLGMKRPPVGAIEAARYASEEFELPPDARLWVLGDGVVEEPDRDGRPIGLPWLERTIAARGTGPLSNEPARIESALRAATGAARLQDDFTLLLVRIA